MEGERHVNKLKIKCMGTVVEVYTQYASGAQRKSGYIYLEARERKDSKMTLGRWQLLNPVPRDKECLTMSAVSSLLLICIKIIQH